MSEILTQQVARAIWQAYAIDTGHALPAGEANRLAEAAIDALRSGGYQIFRPIASEEEAEDVW